MDKKKSKYNKNDFKLLLKKELESIPNLNLRDTDLDKIIDSFFNTIKLQLLNENKVVLQSIGILELKRRGYDRIIHVGASQKLEGYSQTHIIGKTKPKLNIKINKNFQEFIIETIQAEEKSAKNTSNGHTSN